VLARFRHKLFIHTQVDQNIGEVTGGQGEPNQQVVGVSNQQEDDSIALEVERLKQIVEGVSKSVINISHQSQSEQLGTHQARRRQADILNACGGFSQHGEQLQQLPLYQLPVPSGAGKGMVEVLSEPAFKAADMAQLDRLAQAMEKEAEEASQLSNMSEGIIGRLSCMK
jgi:hypothetical protein